MKKFIFLFGLFFLSYNINLFAKENFVHEKIHAIKHSVDSDVAKLVDSIEENELEFVGDNSDVPIVTALKESYFETASKLIERKVSLTPVSGILIKNNFYFLLMHGLHDNVKKRLISFVNQDSLDDENLFLFKNYKDASYLTAAVVYIVSWVYTPKTPASSESQNISILHWAASLGDLDLLKKIFEKGKDRTFELLKKHWEDLINKIPNGGSKDECSQLIQDYYLLSLVKIDRQPDIDVIKDVLKRGANPEAKIWDGESIRKKLDDDVKATYNVFYKEAINAFNDYKKKDVLSESLVVLQANLVFLKEKLESLATALSKLKSSLLN